MEKVIERSPAPKLLEKHCPSCERTTQHECSTWYPSDLEVLSTFNACAVLVVCKHCGGTTVQMEFVEGLLLP